MRNNGRNTVKTRPATRNTYSSRNSSSTRYGRKQNHSIVRIISTSIISGAGICISAISC